MSTNAGLPEQQPETSPIATTSQNPSFPWSEKQSTGAVRDNVDSSERVVTDAEKRIESSVQPQHDQPTTYEAQALEDGLHR